MKTTLNIVMLVVTTFLLVAFPTAAGDGQTVLGEEGILFDFSDAQGAEGWIVVNDGVMGGKSEGGYAVHEERLVFEGKTNTDGGGFSSIRGPLPEEAKLGEAAGIEMRLRSKPGREFKIDLRQHEPDQGYRLSYRATLPMEPKDDWQVVRVPFTAFVGSWRGEEVQGAELKPDKATDLGLFIYDGQDGPFRLEVAWIGKYVK